LRLGLLFVASELDNREHCGVAAAMTKLDDAGIAAVAILEARRNLVEQLLDRLVRLQRGEGAAPRGEIVLLAERDHPVGDAAQFLGLGVGRLDSFVADQREHHIFEQRLAMRRGAIELAARVEMTHQLLQTCQVDSRRSCSSHMRSSSPRGGRFSNRIPSERPMSARTSLISFKDLRPKFLILSMSCSVRCTSSPIYLMSAFCRPLKARTEIGRPSTGRYRYSLKAGRASACSTPGIGSPSSSSST